MFSQCEILKMELRVVGRWSDIHQGRCDLSVSAASHLQLPNTPSKTFALQKLSIQSIHTFHIGRKFQLEGFGTNNYYTNHVQHQEARDLLQPHQNDHYRTHADPSSRVHEQTHEDSYPSPVPKRHPQPSSPTPSLLPRSDSPHTRPIA